MKKPNFLIVGASKSGTTSLASYLNNSDNVFISKVKEPRYFINDIIHSINDSDPIKKHILKTSIFDYETYLNLFAETKKKIVGEASVHYLYHYKTVIPKIKEKLGDIKIIICLRNPIQRTTSNIKYLKMHHKNDINIELFNEKKYIGKNYNSFWFYTKQSMYYNQVKGYKDSFSDVLVITQENLRDKTIDTLNEVYDFLNTSRVKRLNKLNLNSSLKENNFYKKFKKTLFFKLLKSLTKKFLRKSIKTIFKKYIYTRDKSKLSIENRRYLAKLFIKDIKKTEKLLSTKLWVNDF